MRDKQRLVWIASAAVVFLAALAALAIVFMAPPSGRAGEATVMIGKGMDVSRISAYLHSQGLIRSRLAFEAYSRIAGVDRKLKAGVYMIESTDGIPAIAGKLAKGEVLLAQVTLPEGATASAVARLLERAGICAIDDFEEAITDKALLARFKIPGESAEGYLYPDTYKFALGSQAEDVTSEMIRNFFTKLALLAPAAGLSADSLRDAVTLASIVEREYRLASEAPLIASVFLNRLKLGMPLQSCATVVFAMTEHLGLPQPQRILFSDLKREDPYNTYLHPGLPPGPISNPGAVALSAVLNPAKTEYLYFRLDDPEAGRHRFSKTYQEHLQEAIPVKGL